MMRAAGFIGAVLLATPGLAQDAQLSVTIGYPASGQEVIRSLTAEGRVSDPALPVVLVVHPTSTQDYYVQPPVAVSPNGSWNGLVYFGREGLDAGEVFEMQAVAGPSVAGLVEGQVLDRFPTGAVTSPIVRDLVRR